MPLPLHHWLLLLLLLLLQTITTHQDLAKDCHEYCLKCENHSIYRTPGVAIRGVLEVSLQVDANGTLPHVQIVEQRERGIMVTIYRENVTVSNGIETSMLRLASHRLPLSWVTVLLAPASRQAIHVYTPQDKLKFISAAGRHDSLYFVSSGEKSHVAFNCMAGCLIRHTKSAQINKAKLHLPFTMYLNPIASASRILTFKSSHGSNKTVDVKSWIPGTWYRLEMLQDTGKGEQNHKEETSRNPEVVEVQECLDSDTYTLHRIEGFAWTLHCIPHTLDAKHPNDTSTSAPTTPDLEATETTGNKTTTPKKIAERAGAQQVLSWILAGLALFLVMILAFALCSKTIRASPPHHFHDSQPSVGIVYCKGTSREPEEDSEPESPNELKIPDYRSSLKYSSYPKDCKGIEG